MSGYIIRQMQSALNNNEVLLWGIQAIPIDILEPYNVGNKNPKSIKQKGKPKKAVKLMNENESEESENDEEEIKPIRRLPTENFDPSIKYTKFDLPFLERELKRIESDRDRYEEQMEETNDLDEINELGFLSEKMDILLDDIKYEIKVLESEKEIEPPKPIKVIPMNTKPKIGKGFKKGSPEALEHAKKMRENKMKKDKPIDEQPIRKRRIEKGSEEAKAIGERIRKAKEAKKAIQTPIAPEIIVVKPLKKETLKKPWYYIGEIPPRYREATMDEAIKHNMVSEYGKYQVDENKYKYYKNYNIFLSFELSDLKITAQTSAIKKRIENIDKKLETLDIKADNQIDESKKALLLWEISELFEERKDVIKAYNWLMKEYYYRRNMPYKNEKFPIVIPQFNEAKNIITKPDIKKIEQNTRIINAPKKVKKTKKELLEECEEIYVKNGIEVIIKRDFFDENKKLKSEKAFELERQGIILDKSLYKLEDYKKIVYIPKFLQSDDILEELQADLKTVIKAKKVMKSTTIEEPIKPFNINEYEPEFFRKRTKEEEDEYYQKREKEAYERAIKEEEERKNKAIITTEELEDIFRSVSKMPLIEI